MPPFSQIWIDISGCSLGKRLSTFRVNGLESGRIMQPFQKSTIYEVAKLADVSVATVSRIFNKDSKRRVGQEARKRVLAAAEKLKYRPSPIARQLKSRKSRVVCLSFIGSQVQNAIGAGRVTLLVNDAMAGAQLVLEPIDYRIEPHFAPTREAAAEALPAMFWAGNFDAVFLLHGELHETAEELAREGCIVVTGSPPVKARGLPNLLSVTARLSNWDYQPMVSEVVKQGRKHLLFTFPIPRAISQAYARQLKSGHLQMEFFESGDRSRARYVSAIVEAVLTRSVDAILTADEFFGWEIFKALQQCGIEVPEQVTITGAADVRHVFKPLPVLMLMYAEYAQQLREMACRFIEFMATQDPSLKAVLPPPLNPYRPRIQVMNSAQFLAASRAELRREHLQGEVESEILGRQNPAAAVENVPNDRTR